MLRINLNIRLALTGGKTQGRSNKKGRDGVRVRVREEEEDPNPNPNPMEEEVLLRIWEKKEKILTMSRWAS